MNYLQRSYFSSSCPKTVSYLDFRLFTLSESMCEYCLPSRLWSQLLHTGIFITTNAISITSGLRPAWTHLSRPKPMAMSSFLHQECQLLPYLLLLQVLQFQKEIGRQNTQILISILVLFTTFDGLMSRRRRRSFEQFILLSFPYLKQNKLEIF